MKKLETINEREFVIYKIVNEVTNKLYIGYTCYVEVRRNKHFNELRNGSHHSSKLQRSFDKHGESKFRFEIIEDGIIGDKLAIEREIFHIQKYGSHSNGYNMTTGGEGVRGHFGEKHWNRVEVFQYDIQGNFIKKYSTILEADIAVYGISNFRNIQFQGNDNKHFIGKKQFIFTRKECSKSELCNIHRYGLDGTYIDSFLSQTYAARIIGGCEQNITRAIKTKGTYLGFQWRRELVDKISPNVVSSKETTRKIQGKRVIQKHIETGEIIEIFETLSDAVRKYGCSIASCVRKKTKKSYGYKWEYEC